MKTIVQIVQHLRPGGIETMSLDLQKHFTGKGENAWIISLEGDMETAMEHWPRLRDYRERLLFLDKPEGLSARFLLRLMRELRRLKADVVHTHHIGPLLYGGLARKALGIDVHIHTEHDAWHLEDPRRRRLQRRLLRTCRPRLVADADSVGMALSRFLDLNDLVVIRNGIDTRRFVAGDASQARQQLGLPADRRLLGCSGRLELLKGQKLLIDALPQLPADVDIVLAGSGSYEKQLRELVDARGLSSRVHFLGRVDDMPLFYQALDLFCLPSFKEGMPLSPLEAQACDIPAIVTDVGGSVESLCPATGKAIPPGNSLAIVEAVDQLLNNPLPGSPRVFVQQHASVDQMAEGYARLHGRVIEQV